ncbi:hypothetical protein Pint_33949 [Pistacia integerrima]|uniref:Uncharacterized protein n=1 Tax=Pistacia integerrima TaxID=434235 RepID=A0ACC0X7N8_9ROSI|nr:hypothetical protein Pint_33949 [Pistacia integerrima]
MNYQAINVDTLWAQNMESWPFFNQVTADLMPLNARKVAVKFDNFKIASLIPIKAPGRARGELEITYLDEELRLFPLPFHDVYGISVHSFALYLLEMHNICGRKA